MLVQQLQRAHQKSGGTIAALEAMTITEGLLHRMQFRPFGQPFHGQNFAPVGLEGEYRARLYAFAIQKNRTGAAVTGVAADVRAGQAEFLSQQLHQQRPRLDLSSA